MMPLNPAPYLNLSAALLAQGDARDAIDPARRAWRDPKLPQAAYMVGMAYLAAERWNKARRGFRAALNLDPKLADAWVNIGVVQYRLDDVEGAMTAMRQALAVAPDQRRHHRQSGRPFAADRSGRSQRAAAQRHP